ARIAVHRSRLQQTLAGTGTMLAVSLTEDEAGPLKAIRCREGRRKGRQRERQKVSAVARSDCQ
ncbi:hypothetical protein ACWECC_39270, partial [Streptomyces microflavus]